MSEANPPSRRFPIRRLIFIITAILVMLATIYIFTKVQAFAPFSAPTVTSQPKQAPTPLPGTTRKSAIDGMVNIYIPTGSFKMGASGNNPARDDQPRHNVIVGSFWIDRTAVTNAMYALCVKAGGCNLPFTKKTNPHFFNANYDGHPVVYVTWYDAARYCSWVEGRLPTEAEWERAASGDGSRTYPWGNQKPKIDLANVAGFHMTTTHAGSQPAGASPFGVRDMAGNVREWVADKYSANYYRNSTDINPKGPSKGSERVVRGAAWSDPISLARVTSRKSKDPDDKANNLGFRCAFSQ
jgi:formylglycine-generating enzyme required for sulfatase activity